MRAFTPSAAGFALAVAALAVSCPAVAGPVDLTTGKAVTTTGVFGQLSAQGQAYPWCADAVCPTAAASTINDGVYLASGTAWQQGTLWWDSHNPLSVNNSIEIDFGGLFRVDFASIQGDNNDEYLIELRDAVGNWVSYAYASICCTAGMFERSGNVPAFDATAARFSGRGGDGYYALSEVRLTGTALALPEPASMGLVTLALGGALAVRRRRAR